MQIVTCPACSTRIKIKSGVSGKFACPKCQKVLRIKASADDDAVQSNAAATSSASSAHPKPQPPQPSPDDFLSQLPPLASPAHDPLGSYASSSGSSYAPSKAPRKADASLKTFLTKLGIGVGILCGAILLSMPLLAYPKSAACLVPIFLVALGVIGLALWGRIWFIVLGFQQSTLKGFLVMFVPYYWLFFLAKNKQQCIKPLLAIGSALIPGMFGLVIDTFFKPDFLNGSGNTTSLRLSRSQLSKITEELSDALNKAGPDETVTAKFAVYMVNSSYNTAAAELALSRLPGYVAGSFKMSADNKNLTLQYRGSRRDLAGRYGLVLPGEAGIMLDLKPTFD